MSQLTEMLEKRIEELRTARAASKDRAEINKLGEQANFITTALNNVRQADLLDEPADVAVKESQPTSGFLGGKPSADAEPAQEGGSTEDHDLQPPGITGAGSQRTGRGRGQGNG